VNSNIKKFLAQCMDVGTRYRLAKQLDITDIMEGLLNDDPLIAAWLRDTYQLF